MVVSNLSPNEPRPGDDDLSVLKEEGLVLVFNFPYIQNMSLSKSHFPSFNMADFSDSMKKFGSSTSTFFHRAKQVDFLSVSWVNLSISLGDFWLLYLQYTEEQLGKSEATVLDARFESLVEKADRTKSRTEQLLRQTETLLQPNIGEFIIRCFAIIKIRALFLKDSS